GANLYDIESFKQFKEDLVDFWELTKRIGQELARAAICIYRICINFAAVKRLWSSMGLHIATSILLDDKSSKQEKLIINDSDYQVSNNGNIKKETTARPYNQTNQNLEKNENLVEDKEQRWESLISK
ncbi:5655_t:CDS:2, partial [Dentiscutata erythropus]